MLAAELQRRVVLCDAPILEGAIAAAVEAAMDQHLFPSPHLWKSKVFHQRL